MKKEYLKPKSAAVCVVSESIAIVATSGSEGMGSNETPGGDDAFNTGTRRGEWVNLWI